MPTTGLQTETLNTRSATPLALGCCTNVFNRECWCSQLETDKGAVFEVPEDEVPSVEDTSGLNPSRRVEARNTDHPVQEDLSDKLSPVAR